jgi:amidohydrolase
VTLDLDRFLAGTADDLIGLRRHLHAHPELGRTEHDTTALVARRLEAAGLTPRVLGSGTGLICDIGGVRPGPVIALRADLDALPIQDEKDVPYRSTRAGICHACGHDLHTTVLLGTALALAPYADQLPGTVRCVFQPAEELSSGALDVLREGVLDDVRAIFALHCDPRLDAGKIAIKVGAITGAADAVEIVVNGPGGHTARPHLTADLAYVIARVVTDLPAALSRLADPRTGTSLVFGMVSAGTTYNVIPSAAVARGTLRTLDHDAWDAAPKLIERLLESAVGPYDVQCELSYRPGSMARLGVRIPGTELDLHAGTFDADERAIAVGVRVMAQAAVDALQRYH